jgi:hypothetical protein
MNRFLRYSFVVLLAMVMGKLSAQEVTLDFTLADTDNSKVSLWGFPASSKNKTVEEKSFTYGGYTVKVAGSEGEGYYWHDTDHYLLFGKQGAKLTLPAFDFDVERIEIEGNSKASAGVKQNIYVGENAVSTEVTGAQGTNIFDIAADYQAAGNVYVIKVNSSHNNQIKTIKIWKKGTGGEVTIPEAANIAAFTALGSGTEAVLKLDGAKVTYVSPDGKSVYVRDATGGMCFYSQEAFAEASNKWVLGGSVTGKVNIRNNMTQMNITDAAALTHTEGAEYAPVAVTTSELSNHVADLIKLIEDFTVTDISGKFYNNENKDIQLYDNFKLGYTVNAGDVLKNLTGVVILYNSQVEVAPTVAPSTEGDTPTTSRSWDFTKWSDATIANLKADAAASKTSGWSDVEKKADAEADKDPTDLSKDNCFWYAGTANEDGSLSANGVVIEELKGLAFSNSYAPNRSLAIAVNYPSTTLGDYAGGAYLWLGGGKNKIPCFTIPSVTAGSTITMEVESHKPSEGRGVELYSGLDAEGKVDAATKIGDSFTPKTKETHTWTVENDCDVIVYNTNGCHIYNITIQEGSAVEKPLLTLNAPVGNEVTLTFGVYDTEDTYSVDFGDGNLQTALVGIDNKGPVKEDGTTGSATKFTGTVAGDGTIKVYGKNDIWYFIATDGAIPTSFEQPKLMNVVQMSITGANVESVALPAYEKMTQFNFNNSPVKTVDVSKVTGLTSLTINNTTASKYEPQLESIDLSKNTELDYLSLQGNNQNSGKLQTLDLSKNTKLTKMYVQYNQIANITLPADASLSFVNLQDNKLASIDLTVVKEIKDTYLSNNQLTTIDLSKMKAAATLNIDGNKLTTLTIPVSIKTLNAKNNELTSISLVDVTTQCNLEGNKLTLATLPAQPAGLNSANKTKKFTYAPQADLEVAESLMELDLTSLLTVAKGELDPADYATYLTGTTTYSFVTASGTALVEGTDYEVTEPGKFKFLKEQTEKVHAVMLNAAFPKFTDAAPFKTTDFEVKAIVINPDDPEKTVAEGWENLITNGNLAGDDVSCFFSKEAPASAPYASVITPGAGKNNSRGIIVKSADNPSQAWDTQFFIRANKPIPAGTKVHMEFDYMATADAKADTQGHGEPGSYVNNDGVGEVSFTTEWQHVSKDFNASGDIQTIAFNLSKYDKANEYHIDNIVFWAEKAPEIEWVDIVKNGNMEGDEVSNFVTKLYPSTTPEPSVLVAGAGKDGGKGIKIESPAKASDPWDTQFWITLPITLEQGTKFKVEFDYKADNAVTADVQTHATPGNYLGNWTNVAFTTEWQHFEKQGVAPAANNNGQKFQSIAFNLSFDNATTFFFDNIKLFLDKDIAATGIQNVNTVKANDGAIFDLQGRRVNKPAKGLYIIDGKKVMVK